MTDHRYNLSRHWGGFIAGARIVNFVMLNPSTADDQNDDPTIRKCCGFAKRWGFGGITVTNLFALRATKPADLWPVVERDFLHALGEHADDAIQSAAASADLVVAAWGAHHRAQPRINAVLNLVIPKVELYCIGLTKDGFPMHPVMAGYTEAPALFRKWEA